MQHVERSMSASEIRTGDEVLLLGERRLVVAAARSGQKDVVLQHPRATRTIVERTTVLRVRRQTAVENQDGPAVRHSSGSAG